MEILFNIVKLLHLLGFASVLGGSVAHYKNIQKSVNTLMLHGALLQLVTGLLLVFLHEEGLNHIKVTFKFVLLILLLGIFYLFREKALPEKVFHIILAIVLLEASIAVLWE